MKSSKKSVGSLAELKHLRKQAGPAPEPATAQPQRRQRPRPPDPGGRAAAPTRLSATPTPATEPRLSLSSEEQALLRQAYAQVQPLKTTGRVLHQPSKHNDPILQERRRHAEGATTASMNLTRVSDQYTSVQAESSDQQYLNPACGTDVLRKLVKGQWPIEASLDLHGANLEQARVRLDGFLLSCLEHGIKCVRIVHGVGYGSKGEPLLRQTTRRWLSQIDAILAYTECPEHEGGPGAVKVVLRQQAAPGE